MLNILFYYFVKVFLFFIRFLGAMSVENLIFVNSLKIKIWNCLLNWCVSFNLWSIKQPI